jgi:hypothetical protein
VVWFWRGARAEGPAADINAAAELSAVEKLAADINAIEAGKATVSGDAVTLTGGVRLENAALTVPSGVTLDLTKETLHLGNGATLTVNGTVNAKAEGINIDSAAASPATINGSGTISLKSKGRLLFIMGDKKLILDGVTLAGLEDNNKSVVEIANGGEFVLKSGAITGNTRASNEWSNGGGVGVWEYGSFTMQGGTISGNRAQGGTGAGGGGVAVYMGTFTMSGGTISGNTAKGGTDGSSSGGGVKVEAGEFTMSGGKISCNTVTGGGGGVKLENSAIFTMSGGTIYGKVDSLPAGTDPSLANSAGRDASLLVDKGVSSKWGTGGTYTKGGASQSGGSDIGSTDDTLIAEPGK